MKFNENFELMPLKLGGMKSLRTKANRGCLKKKYANIENER